MWGGHFGKLNNLITAGVIQGFMSSRKEDELLDSNRAVFSLCRRKLMCFCVPLFMHVVLLRHPCVIVHSCLLCAGLAECLTQQKD